MKRKMMSSENIPSKKTTNGGNGSYMRRKIMQDKVDQRHGKKQVGSNVAGTAPVISRLMR